MLNIAIDNRTLRLGVTINGREYRLDLAAPKPKRHRVRKDHVAPGNQARLWRTSCPEPHYCILEYLARFRPHLLAFMDDVPEATLRDGFKLSHLYKRKFGAVPPKVTAPEVLEREGITEVNAYPASLLEDRFPG